MGVQGFKLLVISIVMLYVIKRTNTCSTVMIVTLVCCVDFFVEIYVLIQTAFKYADE